MDNNHLIEFLAVVQTSPAIKEKLKKVSDAEAIALAKIAGEAGFNIPVEELEVHGRWWKNISYQQNE